MHIAEFSNPKSLVACAVLAAGMAAAPSQAATLLFDPTVSTCTGINCSSITVGGTVMNSAGLSAARWDVAIFAQANECLRLDEVVMTGAGADDEMVVVAPNGDAFRNDDFGGTLRPRVVIRPTPASGWYYVSIARFNGDPAPEHDIQFAFGRYTNSTTNPNCESPTAVVTAVGGAESVVPVDKPVVAPEPTLPDWPTAQ